MKNDINEINDIRNDVIYDINEINRNVYLKDH